MPAPAFVEFPAGLRLLNAVTADETASAAIACNHLSQIGVHVYWNGTVSAGQVIIEAAPDQSNPDAWGEVMTFNGASDSNETQTYPGPLAFVRARVNTAVAGGGNVTVYLQGLMGP